MTDPKKDGGFEHLMTDEKKDHGKKEVDDAT